MLTHLCSNGATLDDVNIQELISTMDGAWNPTENPATKFERDDRIEQKIKKVGIPVDPQQCLALFKAAIKCTGTFNLAICEWETKPKGKKTFAKFLSYIVKEFSKAMMCKLPTQPPGIGIANNVEATTPFTNDIANLILKTTTRLVNAVTAQNDKILDNLIKLQTETLTTFQKLLKAPNAPANTNSGINGCPCKN